MKLDEKIRITFKNVNITFIYKLCLLKMYTFLHYNTFLVTTEVLRNNMLCLHSTFGKQNPNYGIWNVIDLHYKRTKSESINTELDQKYGY